MFARDSYRSDSSFSLIDSSRDIFDIYYWTLIGWVIVDALFGEAEVGMLLLETLIDFYCKGVVRYWVSDKDEEEVNPLF